MIAVDKFTVGNTINVAVAIYKQNWKKYLKLSLIAHLWLFIPIYGWARYLAVAAWISRLGRHELSNDLEVEAKKNYFSLRSLLLLFISNFFTIIFLYFLSIVIAFIIFLIGYITITIILGIVPLNLNFIGEDTINLIVGFSYIFICLIFITLFYARLFIKDAIDIEAKIFTPIRQSYTLTKRNTFKVLAIIWLSFVISFPIWIISYFLLAILFGFVIAAIQTATSIEISFDSGDSAVIFYLLFWLTWVNFLIMPLWQLIKAVTYFQLHQSHNLNFDLKPRD